MDARMRTWMWIIVGSGLCVGTLLILQLNQHQVREEYEFAVEMESSPSPTEIVEAVVDEPEVYVHENLSETMVYVESQDDGLRLPIPPGWQLEESVHTWCYISPDQVAMLEEYGHQMTEFFPTVCLSTIRFDGDFAAYLNLVEDNATVNTFGDDWMAVTPDDYLGYPMWYLHDVGIGNGDLSYYLEHPERENTGVQFLFMNKELGFERSDAVVELLEGVEYLGVE